MFSFLSPMSLVRQLFRFRLLSLVFLAAFGPAVVDFAMAALVPIREGNAKSCRIWSVTDGDTLKLACLTRGRVDARLLGFDTPELYSPSCTSEFLRAYAATWVLRWKLWGADRIEMKIGSNDRYGRSLVDVRLDGKPLASVMAATGLARRYDGGRRQTWCTGLF